MYLWFTIAFFVRLLCRRQGIAAGLFRTTQPLLFCQVPFALQTLFLAAVGDFGFSAWLGRLGRLQQALPQAQQCRLLVLNLAAVLVGSDNQLILSIDLPAGKLPQTFPATLIQQIGHAYAETQLYCAVGAIDMLATGTGSSQITVADFRQDG